MKSKIERTEGLISIPRKRSRFPPQLQLRLLEVIEVEMHVAESGDEIAGLEIRDLRDHHREQRVGRDIERHAEEDVGGALIELAGESAVRDVELEKAWQGANAMRGRSAGFRPPQYGGASSGPS